MKLSDLDKFFLGCYVISACMFLMGAFFDPIANHFTLRHSLSFGMGQILWCAFWGICFFITSYYDKYHGS